MSVYMIVEVKEVMDKKMYGEYVQKASQTVLKFGGKYLVRGGQAKTVSGEWNPGRILLSNLLRWINSTLGEIVLNTKQLFLCVNGQ